MPRGLFITFEGGEGLGKTTQVEAVRELLREKGFPVITTKEPGGTAFGDTLRGILLESKEGIAPMAEVLLMQAQRVQHVEELTRPAVGEGQIVLCDRYVDSMFAYQGYGRGMDVAMLKDLHHLSTDNFMPDLTFVFTGKAHRERGGDRFERLGVGFHALVNAAFELMAFNSGQDSRFRHVRAYRPVEAITERIAMEIESFYYGGPGRR